MCALFIFSFFSTEGTQLAMDVSDTSSTISSSESNEYHEHNIWNPMLELLLELLFHTHIGISMEAPFCEERSGANRTFPSHFALDVLCGKE